MFADVLGRALDDWWETLGRPDPYLVVDAGTGPGTLARQLSQVDGASASVRTVVGYDHDDDPVDLEGAVVIANELLDNLPFQVVERTASGWVEWWVSDALGQLPQLEQQPIDDDDRAVASVTERLDGGGKPWPVGLPVPVLERARAWVDDVLAQGAAMVIVFDYGAATTAELGQRRGWLRTYRQHHRGDNPLQEPGQWDITTDVAVDQLPPPAEVLAQADFLRRHGIEELVDEGRRYWKANAARPDLQAMRMRSRVREAEALTDPDGLGGWFSLCWKR